MAAASAAATLAKEETRSSNQLNSKSIQLNSESFETVQKSIDFWTVSHNSMRLESDHDDDDDYEAMNAMRKND